jgi:hypothetical protein
MTRFGTILVWTIFLTSACAETAGHPAYAAAPHGEEPVKAATSPVPAPSAEQHAALASSCTSVDVGACGSCMVGCAIGQTAQCQPGRTSQSQDHKEICEVNPSCLCTVPPLAIGASVGSSFH